MTHRSLLLRIVKCPHEGYFTHIYSSRDNLDTAVQENFNVREKHDRVAPRPYSGSADFFFFFAHFYFPASGQAVVTGVVPSPPQFLPSIFIAHLGLALPLLVDFSSSVANSRSRAFRKSICAQEKVPTKLYEYALGGARTHETDLSQARG